MDHLPHPQDAKFPLLKIPHHPKFSFDKGTFTDFPTRCGFDKTDFQWGIFSSIPLDDHTAFFQSWLFFGVLYEFFGGVDLEEFIDEENGVVTTAALPKLAKEWQKKLPMFSKKARSEEARRVNRCLKEMRDMVSFVNGIRHSDGKKMSECSEEVCHSIIVLGLTLEEIRNYHHGLTPDGGMDNEERLDELVGGWPISRLATRRLEEGGLCKSAARRLQKYIFSTGMVYCGSMKSFGRTIDHGKCREDRCVAEDVDERTYKTAHAKGCVDEGNCEHIGVTGPLLDDVWKILRNGGFPVVALAKTKGGEIRLGVESWKKSISYTAFTHVWADGLGNPHGNTLPSCQFNRLYDLLTMLSDRPEGLSLARNALSRFSKKNTVYLWIDTLCIPREKELRKKAINRMYSVYEKATKVLLLDESLLSISSHRPVEELCFRITVSPWMRRAWTLQEGALASTLFVQFADGPMHIETAIESLFRRTRGMESYNVTLVESCITLQHLQHCRRGEIDMQVTAVHSGLIDRSTTHAKDKELCMAIMLGCDMGPIQEASGEERTKRVYEQMEYIPDSFFWHRNTCLDIVGFRWAPMDLWSTQASGATAGKRLKLKDGHVVVQASGMVYRARSHYMTKAAPHVRDWKTGKWYNLRWHEGEEYQHLASHSKTNRTVLAVVVKTGTIASPIKEGVVVSLDWASNANSKQELSNMVHAQKQLDGAFVGRALLEEIDGEDTAMLSEQSSKHVDIEKAREDVRSGKLELDDRYDERLKRIILEDDDDWWVFDGEMMDERQLWAIE